MSRTTLNKVISKYTAFDSFTEMEASLKTGYVPTIKPKNKELKALILTLQVLGYRVWTGQ